MTASLTMPSVDDFEAQIGSTFRITGEWSPDAADGAADAADDGPGTVPAGAGPDLDVALVLTTVHRLDLTGPFEQFRLSFTGPAAQPLGQGSYLISHEALPLEVLFIVPSSEQGDIRTYEASFSVKRPTPQGNET